MILETLKKE